MKNNAQKGHRWSAATAALFVSTVGLLTSSADGAVLATTLHENTTLGTTQFRGFNPFLEFYFVEEGRVTSIDWVFNPDTQNSTITIGLYDLRDGTLLGELVNTAGADKMALQSFESLSTNGYTISAGTPIAAVLNGHGDSLFSQVETPNGQESSVRYFGTRAYFVEEVDGQTLRDFTGSSVFQLNGIDVQGSAQAIPEPSSTILMLGGFGFLVILRRRSLQ